MPIGISVGNSKSNDSSSFAAIYFHSAAQAITFARTVGSINLPKTGFISVLPRFMDLEGQANGVLRLSGFNPSVKEDTIEHILDNLGLIRTSYVFSHKARSVRNSPFPPYSLSGDCCTLHNPRNKKNPGHCQHSTWIFPETRNCFQWPRESCRKLPAEVSASPCTPQKARKLIHSSSDHHCLQQDGHQLFSTVKPSRLPHCNARSPSLRNGYNYEVHPRCPLRKHPSSSHCPTKPANSTCSSPSPPFQPRSPSNCGPTRLHPASSDPKLSRRNQEALPTKTQHLWKENQTPKNRRRRRMKAHATMRRVARCSPLNLSINMIDSFLMLTFPFVENLMSCFSQLCNKKILLKDRKSVV